MGEEPTQRLNDISPAEIDRLLKIAGAAQGFLRHDLAGDGGMVLYLLRKVQDFFDGKMTAKDLRRLKGIFSNAQPRFSNLMKVINNHIVDKEIRWGLLCYLPEIAESVASNLEERGEKIISAQGPPVHVIYPRNALYSIMLELARNAAAHAPDSQVAAEWSIESGTLTVSIHDSGKAIDHLLTDRFLALELAHPKIFKPKGGLSIISRIVNCSEGLLLVRRSEVLGGAEFSVRLPVISSFEEVDL